MDKSEIRQEILTQTAGWGYELSPINPGTEDPDGTIRIWHSKISSNIYPTKKACMEAGQKGLEHLDEAWNFDVNCTSPPKTLMPIVTVAIDVSEIELEE